VTDRAFLFSRLAEPGTILLESSRRDPENTNHFLFHNPIEILTASSLDAVPELFRSIEQHRRNGRWAAGYAAYESGYHFDSVIPSYSHTGPLPLIWFGIYEAPSEVDPSLLDTATPERRPELRDARFSIPEEEYHRAIAALKGYIVNGDTYQVNFTDRFTFSHTGDPRDLYLALRSKQHVPFSAYLNTGGTRVLSFSPELFFRVDGRSISTKPMKGTAPRGRTNDEDRTFSRWLQNDEKNRSENLMIVDLLRNDIGRICETGSVRVTDMFSVERYETVLQMTSTVAGTLRPGISYYDIFKALFPCGSVTGAPKIRTMQIINELEHHPRGVYCGAIGFIAPDDRSVFSVAIRTLTLNGTDGTMGVGSGIVYDSVAEKEYDECRLKAAFLLNDRPEFSLFETVLWNGSFSLLAEHLERLKASAEYFQFPYDEEVISDALASAARAFRKGNFYRVRISLPQTGAPTVTAAEYQAPSVSVIAIAKERVSSQDTFLYHKTTNRSVYDRNRTLAEDQGLADIIFLNEQNEVTEGTITNIFIEKDGMLFTPPVECGLLPGIYRQQVLRTNANAAEKRLSPDDLRTADAIFLCNSLRGWTKVTLSE
jgi:para-aminobenzoate synthetase/4-amino-4-deoxychorismate lyase